MDTRTDSPADSATRNSDQGVRTCRSARVKTGAAERQEVAGPEWNIVRGED